MKNLLLAVAAVSILAPHAHAETKDKTYNHAADFKVATLDQTLRVHTGEDATAAKTITDGKLGPGGQGVHVLDNSNGRYRVEAPVNTGRTILSAMTSSAYRPALTIHNQWFLDKVEAGTKVLFASSCAAPNKKHPNDTVRCTFWFPDPDSTTHEYMTQGDFTPVLAGDGSNTAKVANALCGTGKLNAAVEAQVCTADTTKKAEAQ